MITKSKMSINITYLLIVFFVCSISVYDNILNVIYTDGLLTREKNPVGTWLIETGGVSLFVTIKAITTIIAALLAIRIVYSKYRIALVVVLIFQVFLFIYLSFYGGEMFYDVLSYDETPMYNVYEFYYNLLMD